LRKIWISNILLDDITETVTIKRREWRSLSGNYNDVHTFDIFTYDEYEALQMAGLRGARIGRVLRGNFEHSM